MRDIYRTARSVRIWFGEEDPTPTPLGQYGRISRFTMKRHLGEFGSVPILLVFINQALRNNDSTGRVWYGQLIANMVPATRHRFHGFVPPAAAEWKIPAKFFDNDWFKRVWTIQEAAVSNVDNAVVVLGEWEIKWWAVGKAAQWFKENLYSSLPTQNATATWQITLQSKERVPLLTLLETARNRGASNGRDRVYAMLGLAKDINIAPGEPYSRLLRPNYRKTEQAVFHHAAMHLLKRDKTLSVLSHCEQSNTLAFYFSPSWVPVWSVPQAANPFPFKTTYAKCPFRADDGKEREDILSKSVREGERKGHGSILALLFSRINSGWSPLVRKLLHVQKTKNRKGAQTTTSTHEESVKERNLLLSCSRTAFPLSFSHSFQLDTFEPWPFSSSSFFASSVILCAFISLPLFLFCGVHAC